MYVEDADDRPGIWCKAPPGSQAILVGADPKRFFVPPYVGHKGWVGMRLDRRVKWSEVAVVVERSWRLTAPKRLVPVPKPKKKKKKRKLGTLRGQIWIAEDFDAPLPDDTLDAFEGREPGERK